MKTKNANYWIGRSQWGIPTSSWVTNSDRMKNRCFQICQFHAQNSKTSFKLQSSHFFFQSHNTAHFMVSCCKINNTVVFFATKIVNVEKKIFSWFWLKYWLNYQLCNLPITKQITDFGCLFLTTKTKQFSVFLPIYHVRNSNSVNVCPFSIHNNSFASTAWLNIIDYFHCFGWKSDAILWEGGRGEQLYFKVNYCKGIQHYWILAVMDE